MSETQITIERLSYGGEGIGRLESGKVVFVSNALPGDTARIRITEEKKRFARAELIELVDASPSRREPDCAHDAQGCGGCGLRHVSDDAVFRLKADTAYREVQKIARSVRDWPELEVLETAAPLDHWRVRVRMQADRVAGLGFYKRSTHEMLPIHTCLAMHPDVEAAVHALNTELLAHREAPRSVLIERVGTTTFASWGGPVSNALEQRLAQLADTQVLGGIRVGWGKDVRYLGTEWMVERAEFGPDTLVYHRRVGTFGQASAQANATLRTWLLSTLRECRGEARAVLDLYSGSGNFSLVAGLWASRVLGVEVSSDAIEGLKRSAEASEQPHVRGVVHDLRRGLPKRIQPGDYPVVILDPPRSGARELMPDLIALAPQDVVYIACSATSMARDINILAEADFHVVEVVAVDMFPRTPHLEMAVRLQRKGHS